MQGNSNKQKQTQTNKIKQTKTNKQKQANNCLCTHRMHQSQQHSRKHSQSHDFPPCLHKRERNNAKKLILEVGIFVPERAGFVPAKAVLNLLSYRPLATCQGDKGKKRGGVEVF